MALVYNMRALAVSDSSYVFWTDSEPDLDGTNAPEAVVTDSIVLYSVGGTATGGGVVASITPHDTTHSPEVLYNFADGSRFTDSSGNGLDLQASSGTVLYADILDLQMININGSNAYRTTNDAALEITGAITIECICIPPEPLSGSNDMILVQFQESGGDESTNILWGVRVKQTTGYWSWYQQYSGAVASEATSTIVAGNEIQHLAMTRASNGLDISFYVNGVLEDTASCPNVATGGTTSKLRLGSNAGNTVRFNGHIGSLKVVASELSADDIKAEYNRTLGPLLGTI